MFNNTRNWEPLKYVSYENEQITKVQYNRFLVALYIVASIMMY